MGLIAKNIEANPLNWMKNHQGKSEAQIINCGYRIRNEFFHFKKFSCKNKKYIYSGILILDNNAIYGLIVPLLLKIFVISKTKMNFTYPKNEKLKSKVTIDLLFSKGKSVSKYPLRLVYMESDYGIPEASGQKIKMGVSVSKKYFKHAVDRNYFKRVLRETYRLNKHLLIDNLDKPYAFMLFYQSKDRLPYEEINTKTIQLFEKFILQIKNEE